MQIQNIKYSSFLCIFIKKLLDKGLKIDFDHQRNSFIIPTVLIFMFLKIKIKV